MKRFTRLSLGFSKKLENLKAACTTVLAYYNFRWRTRKPEEGKVWVPAAMAADVTDSLMRFGQLFDAVMGAEDAMAAQSNPPRYPTVAGLT